MAKRAAIATKASKTKAAKKSGTRKPGTRIDDSAVLAKLASAMRRSPDLRVAAALKKIGVKEPASLRRIAGKYTKELAAAKRAAAAARRKKLKSRKPAGAEMSAQPLLSEVPEIKRSAAGKHSSKKRPDDETRTTPTKPAGPARAGDSAAANAMASPLLPWVNAGLDLSTAAFTTQLQLYSQIMKMAPVKSMVHQQMQFNQAMVSLFKVPLTGFINGRKKPKSK